MKTNNQKRSGFTVYAILTTLTLLSWALYGAYERLVKIDLTTISPSVLTPVNPSLDTTTLDLLEKKRYASDVQISSYVPKTENEPVETSTESGQVNPPAQTE